MQTRKWLFPPYISFVGTLESLPRALSVLASQFRTNSCQDTIPDRGTDKFWSTNQYPNLEPTHFSWSMTKRCDIGPYNTIQYNYLEKIAILTFKRNFLEKFLNSVLRRLRGPIFTKFGPEMYFMII